MSGFVLVHGGFFGGWCWDKVVHGLRSEGYKTVAPTLKGLAERAGEISPDVDLESHIADVVAAIDTIGEEQLTLVGHSYGGFPVMAAADRRADLIEHLVFLDAYVPCDGESVQSIRDSIDHGQAFHALAEPVDWMIAPLSAKAFGLEGEIAELAEARLTPHPYATFTQSVRLGRDWMRIPRKTYIRTTGFTAPYFDATLERVRDMPGWKTVETDKNHCPMLLHPEWTINTLQG